MHLAIYGLGRVGRPTSFAMLLKSFADQVTLCDTKPNLARAVRDDLAHSMAGYHSDVKLYHADRDEDVSGADLVVITAGFPRPQGVQISRRDLASKNATIVRQIAEASKDRNKHAKYIVVSNPVDSMAMICHKFTDASFVISTGTNLETQRFRVAISEKLGIPLSKIQGWVGGEHGEKAVPFWSTVRVEGAPFEQKAKEKAISLTEAEVLEYVKVVSEHIIDGLGATEYGPAASFSRIANAIVRNTDEVLPVATPRRFPGIDEEVWVSVPTRLGTVLDSSAYDNLTNSEKQGLLDAAHAIYSTFKPAYDGLER
jgi:malate dehydrogenase